jgi:hypothetical protein
MSAGSATAGLFFFRFLYKPEYQQVTVMLPMLAEQGGSTANAMIIKV